jgi:hypothetical protein
MIKCRYTDLLFISLFKYMNDSIYFIHVCYHYNEVKLLLLQQSVRDSEEAG